MAYITTSTLPANNLSKTVYVSQGNKISSVLVIDSNNNQKVTPDITINGLNVTIAVNSAYDKQLNIIITSI